MKITRKNLQRLAKNCKYNPQEIGTCVLRALGYNVKIYIYSDGVAVTDKNGKLVYFV